MLKLPGVPDRFTRAHFGMISSLYLHSRSLAKPLRIGVMVDGLEILKVFRKVLMDIKASDFARLELVIVNQQTQPLPKASSGRLSRYLRVLQDGEYWYTLALVDKSGRMTPADVNIEKIAYSPFHAARLEWVLKKCGIEHLYFTGIVTNGGVASTVRDAHVREFHCTVIKDGYHGDTSRMFYVGEPSIQARRLCEMTYECMWLGILSVRPGAYLGDIGHAIQTRAEEHGFSVVREFCGHGIGRKFHEEPQVLHYGRPHTGLKLQPGMVFTIEPMINAGKPGIRQLADGWTIVTKDHSLSAQWEHTVLVSDTGFEVLTVSDGSPEPARLAA
jgi:methionine aminopeptidase type I